MGETGTSFSGGMTKAQLLRYVSRAVTHQRLCIDDCILEEDIRLVTGVGAKFVGRAAHLSWDGHLSTAQVDAHFAQAARNAKRVHQADVDIILQAGVFEILYRGTVEAQQIPPQVFTAFGLPVEDRRFRWADMGFPTTFAFPRDNPWNERWDSPDYWAKEACWPFIGNLETQLYIYYQICRYIDAGFEAVHLGQADKSTGMDYIYYTAWDRVATLARRYAERHARRGIVLLDCHTVFESPGMVLDGRLLMDVIGAGMVPIDTEKKDGALQCKICDVTENACQWIGRSAGGVHPLGFTVDTCPTILELDNYGRPGPVGVYNENYSPWGYDDITWFALQPAWYRDEFLRCCARVLKTTRLDAEGHQTYFLQPPLRRNLAVEGDAPTTSYTPGPDFDEEYFRRYIDAEGVRAEENANGSYTLYSQAHYRANTPSDRCPNGAGQENVIRQIFANSPG